MITKKEKNVLDRNTQKNNLLNATSEFIQGASIKEINEFLDEIFNSWLYDSVSGEVHDETRGSYFYFLRQLKTFLLKIEENKDALNKVYFEDVNH